MAYEKKIRVRYAETGILGRVKPVSILNYFQDIASEHTDMLGVSAFDLFPQNLAWVVFRYQIHISAYPRWKDRLRIQTWRYPVNNLYELRKYEIFDAADHLLIASKSSWILTDLSSKKPLRLKQHLPPEILSNDPPVISNNLEQLPPLTRHDLTRTFHIRMHDLDFNQHVNNSVYAVWAIESIPETTAHYLLPKEIDINYMGESLYGETVTSYTQTLGSGPSPTFLHSLIRNSTQKEITRIKTVWDRFD